MFLLAVLLFRPIEQTISRAVADHVARGEDAPRRVLRSAAGLDRCSSRRRRCSASCSAWTPITDGLFAGEPGADRGADGRPRRLRALLLRARPGRRRAWFGGYGLVLLADGGIRLVARAPAAVRRLSDGGGRGDRRRGRRRRAGPACLSPPRRAARAWWAARRGTFAIGSAVALRDAGGGDRRLRADPRQRRPAARADRRRPGRRSGRRRPVRRHAARARSGVPAARASQASLLPSLTTFRARGDEASLHRATVKVALILRRLRGARWPPARWSRARWRWTSSTATSSPPAASTSRCCASASAASWPRACSARPRSPARRRGRRPAPGRAGRSCSSRSSSGCSGTAVPPRQRRLRRRAASLAGLLLLRTLWRERQ